MSTLNTQNITNGTDSITVEGAVKGSAKAWVNFNGTSTVAIRASYNVSSITDNGTGDFSVNFTTAMPDTNYAALATTNDIAWGAKTVFNSYLTTAVRARSFRGDTNTFSDADPSTYSVAVFR